MTDNEKKLQLLTDNELIENIARACHNANKEYCESLSDDSQPTWELAPQWQKDSAINGVIYRIKNPDVTNEDMHDNWLRSKIKDNWVYGEVKDEEKRTHPCMVPYHDLPKEQQVKDALFSHTVDTMVGLYINMDILNKLETLS